MKEVKVYLRCQKVEEVIGAIDEIDVNGITLIDVMGLGAMADPHTSKYASGCLKAGFRWLLRA